MLEVCYVAAVLANCCVLSYTPVEMHWLQITLRQEYLYFHIKYASNMAACYDSDVNDVTVPQA